MRRLLERAIEWAEGYEAVPWLDEAQAYLVELDELDTLWKDERIDAFLRSFGGHPRIMWRIPGPEQTMIQSIAGVMLHSRLIVNVVEYKGMNGFDVLVGDTQNKIDVTRQRVQAELDKEAKP